MSEIDALVQEYQATGNKQIRNRILRRLEIGSAEYYGVLDKIQDKKDRKNVLREALQMSRESAERQNELNVEFKETSNKLQSISTAYETAIQQLHFGQGILKQLVNIDKQDRKWLYMGLAVFLVTILWIFYKRFWWIY